MKLARKLTANGYHRYTYYLSTTEMKQAYPTKLPELGQLFMGEEIVELAMLTPCEENSWNNWTLTTKVSTRS